MMTKDSVPKEMRKSESENETEISNHMLGERLRLVYRKSRAMWNEKLVPTTHAI